MARASVRWRMPWQCCGAAGSSEFAVTGHGVCSSPTDNAVRSTHNSPPATRHRAAMIPRFRVMRVPATDCSACEGLTVNLPGGALSMEKIPTTRCRVPSGGWSEISGANFVAGHGTANGVSGNRWRCPTAPPAGTRGYPPAAPQYRSDARPDPVARTPPTRWASPRARAPAASSDERDPTARSARCP